jgi:hypothetical protein
MIDVGPLSEELRRLEDYDWFLRLGLKGGKLTVQPLLGALIRNSGVPADNLVQDAIAKLRRKWLVGHWQLSAQASRNMRAYLRLESGVSALRQGSKLKAAAHLASSLLLVPRFTPQLSPSPQLMH